MTTHYNTCSATTRKGTPCHIRLRRGEISLCHVHDPDGPFRSQLRMGKKPAFRPDLSGQMLLLDLTPGSSTALHNPPSDEQAKVIRRRLNAWSKEDA